ncbi:MAG: hypothetical protein JSS49_22300 [Planctomycetes bacterium]|nr:hypothetical protein [Planctomycetota bacterium]
MISLFNFAVINALTIVPLALLVWVISRIAKRPALAHALWVLVLLKLVTPPLFQWPVIEIPVANQIETTGLDLPTTPVAIAPDQNHSNSRAEFASSKTGSFNNNGAGTFEPIAAVPAPSRPPARAVGQFLAPPVGLMVTVSNWWEVLAYVWCGGVVLAVSIQGWYAIRFARRILKSAAPCQELQEQVARLAHQMNLNTVPEVRIVAATVSPLLWSCGPRTTLLFPIALKMRLDSDSVATLLIHELAHYRRGDHWVRWLELIATSLFWWHPVLWWARNQIEDSEEECCDAWVVGQVPHQPRTYAEALLDTIDFLCNAPREIPPLASGLGNAAVLRRRLTKIMSGPSVQTMSRRLRMAVGLLAALLLPMGPLVFGSGTTFTLKPAAFALVEQSRLLPTPSAPTVSGDVGASESQSDLDNAAPRDLAGRSRSRRSETAWSTAVSPDGRFIIRATTGRRVLLSDLSLGRESDLSSEGITAVSFVPNGEQFAAIASDGRLMIWDAVTAELRRVLFTHDAALRTVAVSPHGDSVAVGARDGTLLILDLLSGDVLKRFPQHASQVNCVRYSQDGNRLAVAVGDWKSDAPGTVRLIELNTGTAVDLDCRTTPGAVMFVSTEELIVGEWNGHSTLWNLINHEIVGAAVANKSIVAAASFSPDNPQLREIAFESSDTNEE